MSLFFMGAFLIGAVAEARSKAAFIFHQYGRVLRKKPVRTLRSALAVDSGGYPNELGSTR